jgi:protein-tyrosine phosphatase
VLTQGKLRQFFEDNLLGSDMVRVLFVCMGNICRSPTAEGVFRHKVEQEKLENQISIDSAGTHAYHVGSQPDTRAQQAASKRNIDLSSQRARRVTADDFTNFDFVIAMDESNKDDLLSICPSGFEKRVHLFLDFADCKESEVPDPYYGQGRGFEIVLNLVEEASSGLLTHIREKC